MWLGTASRNRVFQLGRERPREADNIPGRGDRGDEKHSAV